MDGDGIEDLVIGASGTCEVAPESGKVYFLLGRENGWPLGESLAGYPSVVGREEGVELSQSTPLGDVNGDGLADLALNYGHSHAAPPGDNYVVLGKAKGWVSSLPVDDVEGHAINANNDSGASDFQSNIQLGDVDGDGLDDWFLNGQALFRGEAHLVPGADVGPALVLPDDGALWVIGGHEEIQFFHAGDLNGDGRKDLLAWAPYNGLVYLILGRSTGLPHGVRVADAADCTLAVVGGTSFYAYPVGDVNGDGRDDLNGDGIADLGFSASDGFASYDVHLAFGRATWPATLDLADADVSFRCSADFPYPHLPYSAEHVGDFDGDGLTDLLLRDWSVSREGVEDLGLISIFRGRTDWDREYDAVAGDVAFVGSARWERVGTWASLGDFNGDGADDLAVSSYYATADFRGQTFVFYGRAAD
jgi:hypothetical protein